MGQQVRINEYEPDRNRRFYRGSVESCGTATAKTNPIFKAYVVNLKSSTLPLLLETVEQQPAFITVLPLWDDTVLILIVISGFRGEGEITIKITIQRETAPCTRSAVS